MLLNELRGCRASFCEREYPGRTSIQWSFGTELEIISFRVKYDLKYCARVSINLPHISRLIQKKISGYYRKFFKYLIS